jgi:hypothetical protein
MFNSSVEMMGVTKFCHTGSLNSFQSPTPIKFRLLKTHSQSLYLGMVLSSDVEVRFHNCTSVQVLQLDAWIIISPWLLRSSLGISFESRIWGIEVKKEVYFVVQAIREVYKAVVEGILWCRPGPGNLAWTLRVGGIFTLNPALSAGQMARQIFLVGCAIKHAADRANQCLLLYTHHIRTRRL